MTILSIVLLVVIVSLSTGAVIAAYLEPTAADILEVEISDAMDIYLDWHDQCYEAHQEGWPRSDIDYLADMSDNAWENYQALIAMRSTTGEKCNAKQRES